MSLEQFIEQTNAATSKTEVSTFYAKALAQHGYDRFCYSHITDHPFLGTKAHHGIVNTYPEMWMAHYAAQNYAKKDPVPRYCLTTTRPFTWQMACDQRKLSDDEKRIMYEAEEAHLHDGIAVPICGHNGELAGVGLASSAGGVTPDKLLLAKIATLTFQFHLAYTDLATISAASNTGPVQLTAREKEILLWIAEGKSDSVIAEILSLSHATIRFHLNNVFRKLNANERTLATVKAIRLGLILPSTIS